MRQYRWCTPHTARRATRSVCLIGAALFTFGCPEGIEESFVVGTPEAAAAVGERLFLETRFAQAFKAFLDRGGHVNDAVPGGDPLLENTAPTDQPLPGPFVGLTMNCRTCHLVDEQVRPERRSPQAAKSWWRRMMLWSRHPMPPRSA